MKKDLHTRFEEAYTFASETNKKLPPDVMLQFYAYYKDRAYVLLRILLYVCTVTDKLKSFL